MSRRKGDILKSGNAKRMIRAYVLERDGWHCHYCLKPFTDESEVTLDHYVPWSVWRQSKPRNLVAACQPCNNRKADALPVTLAWLVLANARTWGLAA